MKALTSEQENQIISQYQMGEKSIYALAREYNISPQPIYSLFDGSKIQILPHTSRKFQANYNYFADIDSPDKAYFLGWMFTDGYNNENKGCFRLAVNDKDEEILFNFKKYLKSQHHIRYSQYITKTNKLIKTVAYFHIHNKILSGDLAKMGCKQNKTYSLEYPESLKTEFFKYFLRGVFEGDGCLSLYIHPKSPNRKSAYFSITGASYEFLLSISKKINNILGIDFKIRKDGNTYTLYSSSLIKLQNFFKYLYEDNLDLSLSRKFSKVEEMMQINIIRRKNR